MIGEMIMLPTNLRIEEKKILVEVQNIQHSVYSCGFMFLCTCIYFVFVYLNILYLQPFLLQYEINYIQLMPIQKISRKITDHGNFLILPPLADRLRPHSSALNVLCNRSNSMM